MPVANTPLTVTIKRPSQDPAFQFTNVFTRKINELAQRTADMMLEEVQFQITSKRLVATEELLNSLDKKVMDNASGKLASVGSDVLQARVVETGSKPQHGSIFGSRWESGHPTHKKDSQFMGNILTWMGRKGISGGRKTAFLIARKIARKGIPSSDKYPLRHPFTNAQRNVRRKVNRLWEVELDKAIERLNNTNA